MSSTKAERSTCLCAHLKDEQGVSELIGHFHPPVMAGLELSVDVLKHLSGGYRCLFPGRMNVRQLFTLCI